MGMRLFIRVYVVGFDAGQVEFFISFFIFLPYPTMSRTSGDFDHVHTTDSYCYDWNDCKIVSLTTSILLQATWQIMSEVEKYLVIAKAGADGSLHTVRSSFIDATNLGLKKVHIHLSTVSLCHVLV